MQAPEQPPSEPVSLLSQPAQPASVTLLHGKLLVKADNSSLIQILDALAKTSGMSISGLGQDQRVFGNYGPGNPRVILSNLLEGAGYNVVMAGVTQKGAPKQLVLTARGSAPPSPPQSFPKHAYYPPPRRVFRPPVRPMPRRSPKRRNLTPEQLRQKMLLQEREQEMRQQH